MRTSALLVAGTVGLILLQPVRVSAQWWSRAPADFEECADVAEKAATKEEKSAALAECNAKFAGRRKPGGGYSYYDFMQDRTFDIAGPNPTPEEQRYIDQQYTIYLANQRRNNMAAALMAQQQQQLQPPQPAQPVQPVQQAALKGDSEKVPLPTGRPNKPQQQSVPVDPRVRGKNANCKQDTFSCNWPKLSESLNELKKLFSGPNSSGPNSGAPNNNAPSAKPKRG
jgi:hypothetical protein